MAKYLSSADKEKCVLRIKGKEKVENLAKEYGICQRTIYRWVARYDGTIGSLDNKSPAPLSKLFTKEEEKKLIQCVLQNPGITNKQLAICIGTNRHPLTVRQKRIAIFGEAPKWSKYDYSIMFDETKVDYINRRDAIKNKIPQVFYVIQIYPNLFLRENDGHYPTCITPYFSVALKFLTEEEATKFISPLLKNKGRLKPKVQKIQNGMVEK
ncbi:MAG: helix-turn-helix domain-containing protein [Clostridia bacterium]|nr:helix-turn-helix domain-containing protein [Clostridia bacterium]